MDGNNAGSSSEMLDGIAYGETSRQQVQSPNLEGEPVTCSLVMDGNNAGSSSKMLDDIEYGETSRQQVESPNLEGGSRHRYFEKCTPLREAAMKGDWQAAKKLIDNDRSLLFESITETKETVLHIAAGARKTHFIENLLDFNDIDMERPDGNGNTAFCHAAAAGAKTIAEMMLNKNPRLLTKCGMKGVKPLYHAALFGRGEMAIFLYNKMNDQGVELPPEEQEKIFFACLNAHLYDLALKLLNDSPKLAKARCTTTKNTALHFLARHPSAFRSTIGEGMRIMRGIKSPQNIGFQLAKYLWDEMKLETNVKAMIRTPKHLLFEAVNEGNFSLIKMMIHSCPDLAWEKNEQFPTIFHAAVKHRQADIFYLIHDIGSIKNVINTVVDDIEGDNMLHLVAKLPDEGRLDLIPSAALQMQQELLWYKEVKKIMEPEPSECPNKAGETPKELFMAQHKNLLKDGERWMKKTAESCTFVATLIATVVFATALTMPGGSDQTKGTAVFLNKTASEIIFLKQNTFNVFCIFAISASVALAASITSILFFLAILISPYSQKEFLSSLPLKLAMGFSMLLISMISMMLAFCMAFILEYSKKSKSMPWVVLGISIVPIFLFVALLGPLFWNVCCSANIRKLLYRQRKLMSY